MALHHGLHHSYEHSSTEDEETEVQKCGDLPHPTAIIQAELGYSFSIIDLVLVSQKRNFNLKLQCDCKNNSLREPSPGLHGG